MPHKKQFQPYRYNGRFYNHAGEKHKSTFLPSLIMLFEWYWNLIRHGTYDIDYWYAPEKTIERSDTLTITWIGHSTFLIQVGGINILTDPIFGHLPFFRRQIKPGVELKNMPPIDYVIISHNHRDHMDHSSLDFFRAHPQCTFLVPLGDKQWFDSLGYPHVKEYTWWEREIFTRFGSEVEFSFLPAYHWSQRGLFDFNTSLWGSWMIRIAGQSIYFAGDTAYSPHFTAIGKEFSTVSHTIMPIGPCEPRKWMKNSHINAEEAVQAFVDLNSRSFIPMHWGTFGFGTDHHESPYERLLGCWKKQEFTDKKDLYVLKVGQRFTPIHQDISYELPLLTRQRQLLTRR